MNSCWDFKDFDWKAFGKKLWGLSGRLTAQSAQLSFYLVLALFPFLLFVTALAGIILQQQAGLHDFIQNYFHAVAPGSITHLLDSTLEEVSKQSSGGKLSFGLLLTLWAASNGMAALTQALNVAYGVDEARSWWKKRLVSLGLTLGCLAVIILALAVLLYGPRFIEWAGENGGIGSAAKDAWKALQWIFLLVLLLFAFNLLYTVGPNVKHHQWHWFMPGTVAGVLLWLTASAGFKLYLHYFNKYSATYGSLGAMIILLMWLYLSGLAILVGGELNSALEQRTGPVQKKEG